MKKTFNIFGLSLGIIYFYSVSIFNFISSTIFVENLYIGLCQWLVAWMTLVYGTGMCYWLHERLKPPKPDKSKNRNGANNTKWTRHIPSIKWYKPKMKC